MDAVERVERVILTKSEVRERAERAGKSRRTATGSFSRRPNRSRRLMEESDSTYYSGRCLWGSCKTHVDGGWYCKQHRDPGEREAKSKRVETARAASGFKEDMLGLVDPMKRGIAGSFPHELRALARKAVDRKKQGQQEPSTEELQSWAESLAEDVADRTETQGD